MNSRKIFTTWVVLPLLLLTIGLISIIFLVTSPNQPVLAASNPHATAVPLLSPASLASLQNIYEQIYAKVNPSVVNIHVDISQTTANPNTPQNYPGFNSQVPQSATGSGFVWDTQGHIITNNHVVSGANRITITFSDNSSVEAKLVGSDAYSDLAVLKVDVDSSRLIPVELADSSQVKVGQIAIAIGNPFGLQGTMTQGIISAVGRSISSGQDSTSQQTVGQYTIPDVIQTDASINPGNSGGVLVDIEGKIMGVTAAIESTTGTNSGIGFVIPSSIVNKVIPQLISSVSYKYPWLGISGTTLTPDLVKAMNLPTDQLGALVITIISGGPADKAGLHASDQQTTLNGQQYPIGGDVITAINSQTIKGFDEVISYLFNYTEAGQTVTLTILRQGKVQDIKIILGERPAQ